MKNFAKACIATSLLFSATLVPAHAGGVPEAKLDALIQQNINQWLYDPEVIAAIRSQNLKHATFAQTDIQNLDKQWRAEVKSSEKPMVDGVLANAVSMHLKQVQSANSGLFTEIFVMDNKGLNVGQSGATSDYWQGDEDKWQQSFLKGSDGVFVDGMEFDTSAGQYIRQISVSVNDPQSGDAIGAVTVGVNVIGLLKMSSN